MLACVTDNINQTPSDTFCHSEEALGGHAMVCLHQVIVKLPITCYYTQSAAIATYVPWNILAKKAARVCLQVHKDPAMIHHALVRWIPVLYNTMIVHTENIPEIVSCVRTCTTRVLDCFVWPGHTHTESDYCFTFM